MKTKPAILLVDDNPRLRSAIRMPLEAHKFQVLEAKNGRDAIKIIEKNQPDLIISDILMPECNGYEFFEKVHQRPRWAKIPFLFLTALGNDTALEKARLLGIDEFITKPFTAKKLVQAVESHLKRAEELESIYTRETFLRAVEVMASAVESRDVRTGGHIQRVPKCAVGIARELGWSNEKIESTRLAAVLHDVGKLIVPDAVLNKQGQLTDQEWQIIKQHADEGARILEPLHDLPMVLDGVRYHHERYDGTGYPQGLKEKDIPAVARIIAIADAYDAMTNDRPYRKALPEQIARQNIKKDAGSHFDPYMVAAFIRYKQSNLTMLD